MIVYLVEFALVHLVLILVYMLLVNKETQLTFRRLYLQVSVLFAAAIPLIKLPATNSLPSMDISGTVTTILLPEVVITPGVAEAGSLNYGQWIFWLFISGAVLCLIRLIVGYLKIHWTFKRSVPSITGFKNVHHKPGFKSSFTFFNRIIIDKDHFADPEEVLKHEEAHVKYGHTWDLLVANLLTIPFWWLPSVWMTIKEFKRIHEYQADAYALKASTPEKYIKALVSNVLVNHGMELTSSFQDTKISERLNFIKKMKKNISPLKLAGIGLLVVLTAFVFSCEDKINGEIDAMVEETEAGNYSETVTTRLTELRNEFPDEEFKVIQVSGDKEALQKFDFSGAKFKESEDLGNNEIKLSVIISEDFDLSSKKEFEDQKKANEAYKEVDDYPIYPGGKEELMKYVGLNVKYPKEAAESGVSGKVFVEFVIDKSGEVKYAHVIRGIGSGCDEEALRVVKSFPNWQPGIKNGEPVDVKMVLPVTFQLSE
jgi:TonB family protein